MLDEHLHSQGIIHSRIRVLSPCTYFFRCQVFHKLTSATSLTQYSEDFAPCTFYNVKIIAVSSAGTQLLKETALLRKSPSQCDKFMQVGLIVVLVVIFFLSLLCVGALVYYHRRRPIAGINRVRSKVYSKLYSKGE